MAWPTDRSFGSGLTWKQLEAQGVRRCCFVSKSQGRRCQHRIEDEGIDYCPGHRGLVDADLLETATRVETAHTRKVQS